MSEKSVAMKATVKQIELQVKAMSSLAQDTARRLERAETFIRKLGHCPHCHKGLAPRHMSDSQVFHAKLCRGCPEWA